MNKNTKVFRRPEITKKIGIYFLGPLCLLEILFLWLYPVAEFGEQLFLSGGIAILLLLYFADNVRFKVSIDESGITRQSLFRTTHILWQNVNDILVLDTFTVIKSPKGNVITRLRPDMAPVRFLAQLNTVEKDHQVQRLAFSYSLPFLKQVWGEEKPQRTYQYPSPTRWSYVATSAPMLLAVLFLVSAYLRGSEILIAGWLLFDFLPFLVVSLYLAIRLGLVTKRKKLVLDASGIAVGNGKKTVISWDEIDKVTENPRTTGFGIMIIHSLKGSTIKVPKSIERFCDLALHMRRRVPDLFHVDLGSPHITLPGHVGEDSDS